MKKYIFRNTALEYLFGNEYEYSGYSDVSVSDIYDEYYFCYFLEYTNDKNELINSIKKTKFNLEYVINNIKDKKIYIFTLYNYFAKEIIIADNELEKEISDFNNYLYKLKENTYIIDIKDFYLSYNNCFDSRFFYNYNAIITPKLKSEFKDWFDKIYTNINKTRKKCLIVDFDNTIWNGVLGEDGIDGIGFSGAYPNNIYGEVQRIIKQLKNLGIVLCGVTKNNESDIEEVFSVREDLILKKEDFTIIKAGWDNKVNSILEIKSSLNIGMDSIVFIDDNVFEIELVNKNINEIETILLPEEKYKIPQFLNKRLFEYFSSYNISKEDINKSEMYNNLQKAENMKLSIPDYDSYLKALEMQITIDYLNKNNIDRIVQLINKSNQFNLTTIRYTKEELLSSLSDDDYVYCVSVKDKFGDLGICGVAITRNKGNYYYIENLLISCRIIGRTIENEFLKTILNDLYSKNITLVESKYIKSNKNEQVEKFYNNFGFEEYESSDIEKKYKSQITKYSIGENMEVKFNGIRN